MASFSPVLEDTIHRALTIASEFRHELAALEHLLLALLDDKDAVEVLYECDANIEDLRDDLSQYVEQDFKHLVLSEDDFEESKPTTGFHRVIQRAVIHVQSSGREEVTGANAVIALFAERESDAVNFLETQDVTRYDAVNYLSHGISKRQERLKKTGAEVTPFTHFIVPEQRAASIQAEWQMNKVGVNFRPVSSKHNDEQALATLQSVKSEMQTVLDSISSETNVDKRLSEYLEETILLIPDEIPNSLILQRLSIREQTLSKYTKTAKAEWSEFSSGAYEVICNEFALTLDQFSERREFNRNVAEIELEDFSASEVEADIQEILKIFRSPAGAARVSQKVPDYIETIGDGDVFNAVDFPAEIFLSEEINVDKLESANNTIKKIAERAFVDDNSTKLLSALESDYVTGFEKGMRGGAAEAGEEDGKKAAKAAVRAKAAYEVSNVAGLQLSKKYPRIFGWLSRYNSEK